MADESKEPSFEEALKALTTKKQKQFVLEYLSNGFNGAKAARDAGYTVDNARLIAAQNLTKLNIKAAVEAGMRDTCISASEVVARLSGMARASLAPFLNEAGNLDLSDESARSNLWLVKKYKATPTESGLREEIELHDPKDALKVLAKYHGLLDDTLKVEVTVDAAKKARHLLGLKGSPAKDDDDSD
jgi:phage terminase small subunit